jgi:hypothetical protein
MRAALVALVALLPATAAADDADADQEPIKPDRRARRLAAEANLEPSRHREGFAIGIGIGASMQIGFGIEKASGNGGSLDLRIGTSASDRLAFFLDLFIAGSPAKGTSALNQSNVLGAGAQIFALETIWIRGGAGLGTLSLEKMTTHVGLGMFGGGGIDFLRRGGFTMSGEIDFVTGIYGDGVVSAAVFQLGATIW